MADKTNYTGVTAVGGKVVLYTTTHCSRCEAVKRFLTGYAIPFDEISVLRVPGAIDDLIQQTGAFTAPVLVVGSHYIRGYNPDAMTALLENEGWIQRKPLTVLIDADATPRDAVATTDALADEFHVTVVTVSSINHEFHREGHVTVDAHPQAVDMEIIRRINRTERFVVVTQDYGLAALALAKGASVISPVGMIFTEDNMDRLLFERDLHAKERRARGRSRSGPKARTQADRTRFATALRTVLEAMQ